jgi:hypothetical protein
MFFRLLVLSLLMTSCSTVQTVSQQGFRFGQKLVTSDLPQAARFVKGRVTGLFRGDGSFWEADGMRGKPSVVVSLGEQMVYLYKGGQLAGGSPISSGAEGYDTRPGRYRITEKDIDHKSSIYGDYEDAYGNVILTNIGDASGVSAGVSGVPWVHPLTGSHGGEVFPRGEAGHAGAGGAVSGCVAGMNCPLFSV